MFSIWRMINKVLEDRDVVIPKYIDNKIDPLNSLLEQAYGVRSEIETWAEKNGMDTSDTDWYENVMDESSTVSGICKEGLYEYYANKN